MPQQKEAFIIDDILQMIMNHQLLPGEKLPSENELADRYHVPRMTVRKALNQLEGRGYIYAKQGKGRYLKQAAAPIKLHLTGKESFTEKMKQAGYNLHTENITCELFPYQKKIFDALEAFPDEPVYQIARVRYIDGEPIAIHRSFVREHTFPNIKEDGHTILSMFAYYRQHGYEKFASSKAFLSVAFPTVVEQSMLAAKTMIPLLMVESNCIDQQSEQVLEYTKILYRSDKFKYDITMD